MVVQKIPPRCLAVRFAVIGDPHHSHRGGDVTPPGFLPVFDFNLVERSGIDLHPAEPLSVNGFDDAVEVVVVVEAVGGVVGKYAQRLVESRPPDGIIAAQLDVAVIVVGIVDSTHRCHGVGPGGTVGVGARLFLC